MAPDMSGRRKPRDSIVILGAEGRKNILTGLKEVLDIQGRQLKIRVEIKDFGCSQGDGDKVNVWTSEVDIRELSVYGRERFGFKCNHLHYSGLLERPLWHQNLPFTGVITVSCVAYRSRDCRPKMVDSFPGSGPVSSRILRRMLEEGLHCDTAIMSADGEQIKCHKFILTGQSDVFEAMFKETSESAESITGVIKMDDMCSKSVKAFLAYLYLDDIGKAVGDCGVALDLLTAAHKYDIPRLEVRMKHVLSSKPEEWFNVEVAMRLRFFVKNLEDTEALIKKTLLIMKKHHSTLNELPAYIQLFDEEPQAARQLCADLVAVK